MTMSTRVALLGVFLAALAVACGGGGEDTQGPVTSSSSGTIIETGATTTATSSSSGTGGGGGSGGAAPTCGDGAVGEGETCDDANEASGDGCDATCGIEPGYLCAGEPSACHGVCGDAFVVSDEECDDGNFDVGDGCDDLCAVEPGYLCVGETSLCVTICGDGLLVGLEACDDGNLQNGDGCSSFCAVDGGFACSGEPSVCGAVCGDGLILGGELCDDGNLGLGDGCDDVCSVELGFSCNGEPSQCATGCGDGIVAGAEGCDDGNLVAGDGCAPSCTPELGYGCTGQPSVCGAVCGDGIVLLGEACDDGNTNSGDCCSSLCQPEGGCEIEPNNLANQANDFAALQIGNIVLGSVNPIGDADYYKVTIPTGSTGTISATTLDGALGTTCASFKLDSYLTIAEVLVGTLAVDEDGGVAYCSHAEVGPLKAGTYHVVVASSPFNPNIVFDYALLIDVDIATCGNGVVETGETCDDGNVISGDGCESDCLPACTKEVEPNGLYSTAGPPVSLGTLVCGTINPPTDFDYFAVTLTATTDLRVEVFDRLGPGYCAGINPVATLFDTDGTTLLSSQILGGLNLCSLIDSTTTPAAAHLPPGTYYLQIEDWQNDTLIPGYTVLFTANATCGDGVVEGTEECEPSGVAPCDASCDRIPVCGDGFIDPPEVCEDGNAASGDGCDSTCQLENVVLEIEPNDTFSLASASSIQLTGNDLVGGSAPVGDADTFLLTLATSTAVRLETFGASANDCPAGTATRLRVFDLGQNEIYGDYDHGTQSCSALVVYLNAGSYYVRVEDFGSVGGVAGYVLQTKTQTSLGVEVEPNGVLPASTSFPGSDVSITGTHQLSTDQDWYAITVPQGTSVRAETIEGNTETCENLDVDSRLTLYNAAAAVLADDDDGGRGYCALIDGTGQSPADLGAHALAAGTYYLLVQASSAAMGTSAQFNYRLVMTLRAP